MAAAKRSTGLRMNMHRRVPFAREEYERRYRLVLDGMRAAKVVLRNGERFTGGDAGSILPRGGSRCLENPTPGDQAYDSDYHCSGHRDSTPPDSAVAIRTWLLGCRWPCCLTWACILGRFRESFVCILD